MLPDTGGGTWCHRETTSGEQEETEMKGTARWGIAAAAFVFLVIGTAGGAWAHCDTLDGPVVTLARQALEKGDVKIVLPWVAKEKEGEIRKAFDLAAAVRGKGEKERELADAYFFETLVRVHREGEGAPYTGLKPAGLDLGPAIPAADKALETGNPGALLELVNAKVHEGIHKYYTEARERKAHAGHSVETGRAYVQAYVPYLHFVERLYESATTPIAHGTGEGAHEAHGRAEPAAGAPEHAH